MAENVISSKIIFEVDHTIIDSQTSQSVNLPSKIVEHYTDYLLIIIIGIIAIAIISVLVILKQKSKIPQKN